MQIRCETIIEEREIKKTQFLTKSEAKVCLELQEIPGGGGLAVPDLIKEIVTGSGDTEKQVADISSQSQPASHIVALSCRGAQR